MGKQSEYLQKSFLKCRSLIEDIDVLKAIGNKRVTQRKLVTEVLELYTRAKLWGDLEHVNDIAPYIQMDAWSPDAFLFLILYELVTNASEEDVKEHFWCYVILLSQNQATVELKCDEQIDFHTLRAMLKEDTSVNRCKEVIASIFCVVFSSNSSSANYTVQSILYTDDKLTKLAKLFRDIVTQNGYEALVRRVIDAVENAAPSALTNDAAEALAIAMCVDE